MSAWLVALLALARAPQQDDGWKRVEPGLALAFPADHGAHPEYRSEWWYLTGQLEDERGERFGFQFTLFRRGLEAGPAPAGASNLRAREIYAGHLALSEVARGTTRFAERLARASPLAGAARTELHVALEDWSLALDPAGTLALRAADGAQGFGFEFALRPEKALVLHGSGGVSAKGEEPGNASAYVSWTRLALEGALLLDGERRRVRGSAWFDHEFGSSVLPAGVAGWDWFGLQLDDGRELMLFVLRDAAGGPAAVADATLVARDGSTRRFGPADFTLASSASWTSPRTGARYPAGWTIAVPDAGLALALTPLVGDCELVSTSTQISYWEGPVAVSGTASGRGYAELTGYAGSLAGRF